MARFWGFPSSLGTMARMKYRLAKHARARSRGGASALNREKFLRIGCLNADGWNEQTEYDVSMAIEAKNLDIFTVVEIRFHSATLILKSTSETYRLNR